VTTLADVWPPFALQGRTGETGSWLTRVRPGQGIGTRMRKAVCALLFDRLDAAELRRFIALDG
jgi:RimJ/RimL family protein N-acetyltransferase